MQRVGRTCLWPMTRSPSLLLLPSGLPPRQHIRANCMGTRSSVFRGASILSCKAAAPVYIPTASARGSPSPTSSLIFMMTPVLTGVRAQACGDISPRFDLRFPGDSRCRAPKPGFESCSVTSLTSGSSRVFSHLQIRLGCSLPGVRSRKAGSGFCFRPCPLPSACQSTRGRSHSLPVLPSAEVF